VGIVQLRDLVAGGISVETVARLVRESVAIRQARDLSTAQREVAGQMTCGSAKTRLAICHKQVYILVTNGACNAWIRS
jgi:hypothetical protein